MVISRFVGGGVERGLRRRRGRTGPTTAGLERHRILQGLELRNEPRHWIGEAKLAFLHHHQDRNGNDRLRHGCDSENRVARHGRLGFEIHESVCFEVC